MNEDHDLIIELLEIFINSILYARNLYPSAIFRKQKAYSIPVYISIYPPLNDYIKNILESARELKKNNQLQRLEIVFYKLDDLVLEKYVFEIDEQIDLLRTREENGDKYLIEFEEEIRKSIVKLDERLKHLKKLDSTSQFKINLFTTQSGLVQLTNNILVQHFPWCKENVFQNDSDRTILPISLFKSTGIQFYVEEYF